MSRLERPVVHPTMLCPNRPPPVRARLDRSAGDRHPDDRRRWPHARPARSTRAPGPQPEDAPELHPHEARRRGRHVQREQPQQDEQRRWRVRERPGEDEDARDEGPQRRDQGRLRHHDRQEALLDGHARPRPREEERLQRVPAHRRRGRRLVDRLPGEPDGEQDGKRGRAPGKTAPQPAVLKTFVTAWGRRTRGSRHERLPQLVQDGGEPDLPHEPGADQPPRRWREDGALHRAAERWKPARWLMPGGDSGRAGEGFGSREWGPVLSGRIDDSRRPGKEGGDPRAGVMPAREAHEARK